MLFLSENLKFFKLEHFHFEKICSVLNFHFSLSDFNSPNVDHRCEEHLSHLENVSVCYDNKVCCFQFLIKPFQ